MIESELVWCLVFLGVNILRYLFRHPEIASRIRQYCHAALSALSVDFATQRALAGEHVLGPNPATPATPWENSRRMAYLPPPTTAELAAVDTRMFASLRTLVLDRRQFAEPGSPNGLSSPRQRQRAQGRLAHERPLPTSLPSSPILPFPATPPCSPALDPVHHRSRLNSTVRVDNPVRVDSPSSRYADFTPRLLASPPRSPLVRKQHAAKDANDFPLPKTLQAFDASSTYEHCRTGALSVRLSFCSMSDSPSIPVSGISSVSPPADTPASHHQLPVNSKRRALQNAPSFPLLRAHALSPVLEAPEPSGNSISGAGSETPHKTAQKRHSMILGSESSHSSPFASDWISEQIMHPENAASPRVASSQPWRSISFFLNNAPTLATAAAFDSSLSSDIHLAALLSPSKGLRPVNRGASPVYSYHPEAPALVITKNVALAAQDEFRDFSAALGGRFERKGWGKKLSNDVKRSPKCPASLNHKRPRAASTLPLLPAFEQQA